MNRKELIDSLVRSRDEVVACFDLPESDLNKTYAPDKWSIRTILAHLADVELVFLWRICRGLAERGSRVEAFDQDVWAEELQYESRPMPLAKDAFLALRNQTLFYLQRMSDDAMNFELHHSEKGTILVGEVANYLATHSFHHLEQIAAAKEGRVWKKRD